MSDAPGPAEGRIPQTQDDHRAEAFCLGYRQCLLDLQSLIRMGVISMQTLEDRLLENCERYEDTYQVLPQLQAGIAQAQAGLTVDLGSFAQYLESGEGTPS